MHAGVSAAPSPVPSSPALGSLPSPALARRLADLCGDERNLLVDFLLHLSEFDSREAWATAGYGSLWAWCTEVLHLREGATARRIGAMKLLRRFPSLEAPLRDGRLCLTTVNLLAPVLDEANVEDLVARASFLSKSDTDRLVVSIRPREAPREGIRKLPARAAAAGVAPSMAPSSPAAAAPGFLVPLQEESAASATSPSFALSAPGPQPIARPLRAEVRPISGDTYSLNVTLDAEAKAELDELVALLSHKTGGSLAATLREAVRCGIAKHGKRKGAVEPERKAGAQKAEPASSDPRFIPVEVKRAVWKRDGGRCAWVSPDGKRCGSRHKLEFGHIRPVALGGQATIENIRLECRPHNRHEAVRMFGAKHMAPYRGRGTASSGSDPS